jgi:LuxR family maltose regulon positive regulatory protein
MADIEGALRGSMRDDLRHIGLIPATSKLYRPSPGLVPRTSVVDRVQAHGGAVVTVTAPAGYGKSTFIAELAAADPRPTAWVSLTAAENDPAALLTYVALAIDEIEPVDPECVSALWARIPTIGSAALQQFAAMFASRRQSFTLVLDDLHELVGGDVLDAVRVLVSELPRGSRLVLGGRHEIPLPRGRMRAQQALVEVGPLDLAFDEREAAMLFESLGVDVPPAEIAHVVARTEGWPVALYLATLAHQSGRGPLPALVGEFSGDHRYLVDYFGDELFEDLDPDVAAFLLDASCLDRISGRLCDDLLERTGSADLIERIRRRNLLVIPLDDRREWYRFHHLMLEFLRSELDRRDPSRRSEVHRRASEWFQARADAEGAISHAIRSGDLELAESLVMFWFGRVTAAGLSATVERWLALFAPDELVARPGLMVAAAHGRFREGEAGAAALWLDRAVAALPERHPDDARGPVAPVLLAVARAIIAPLAPAEMSAEARYTYDHADLGEGHPLACVALGAAAYMVGDEVEAARRFHECIDSPLERPLVQASALAGLTVIEVEHGRWDEATVLARRARVLLGSSAWLPPGILVLAGSVLVETHAGRATEVDDDRRRCHRLLVDLVGVAPWLNLQARLALARDALLRGDRAGVTTLLDEVDSMLAATPEAVGVARQSAALRRELNTARDPAQRFGPASLTTAELRVLQLLPTHLSVAEIADRLYVSRNTVKSQTIAIYRKLGASSRGGAIDAAVAAGLLLEVAARP